MSKDWIITNQKLKHAEVTEFDNTGLYIRSSSSVFNTLKEKKTHYQGFILPREYETESVKSILSRDNYDHNIRERLKGNFTIIVGRANDVRIYNDHLGIRKFFWYKKNNRFIVSNNIWLILKGIEPTINEEAIVDHALFNRFIDGKTLWRNISFSGPATKLTLKAHSLKVQQYWDYKSITEQQVSDIGFDEITRRFDNLVNSYVEKLIPNKVSVPMTGGFDCRSIVAALMNNDIEPISYTYGHPESADSQFGKMGAEEIGIDFKVHYLCSNSEGYRSLRREIIKNGCSLASSHRAHRLFGIKRESERADLMFLGYLGGEVIRGLWPDDLIISKAIRELWEEEKNIKSIVHEIFEETYLNVDSSLIDYGIQKLQEYKLATLEESYLKVLFEIKAHLHYAQDLNLFSEYLTPIPFYLDLDYLEMIFGSQHNFLFKESMTKNKLKKLDSPLFNSHLIFRLYPELAEVQLGKGFSPYGFLQRRWWVYLKKGIRHYLKKPKYKPNYGYGNWYIKMTKNGIEERELKNFIKPDFSSFNSDSYTEKEMQHLTRIWDLQSFIERANSQ